MRATTGGVDRETHVPQHPIVVANARADRRALEFPQIAWFGPPGAHIITREGIIDSSWVRESIVDLQRLGVHTLLVGKLDILRTHTDGNGRGKTWLYYDSAIEPFQDTEGDTAEYWNVIAKDQVKHFDFLDEVLRVADERKMNVIVGLGRGGDKNLLRDVYRHYGQRKPVSRDDRGRSVPTRLRDNIAMMKRRADSLHNKYGHHSSFYG